MKKVIIFVALLLCACHREEKIKSLEIHLDFGYKDARPARFVGDRYERLRILQDFLKPCSSVLNFACGFSRDAEDADLLTKKIKNSEDQNWLIQIRLMASSSGPDDDENRRNPYQAALSKRAMANFRQGLRQADAVFYIGHSRDGGGPDFSPPVLSKNDHVNYDWYKKNKPGLSSLLSSLKRIPARNKNHRRVLGLMSCASRELFTKKIRQVDAHLELVTVPDLLYYVDALDLTQRAVSDFIESELTATAGRTRPQISRSF